ncbi:MAG: hypothetical protein JW751_26045 [Polyangiaceae bacterium]|nr:hypothetical protein [Polyangiaceae bacterium]
MAWGVGRVLLLRTALLGVLGVLAAVACRTPDIEFDDPPPRGGAGGEAPPSGGVEATTGGGEATGGTPDGGDAGLTGGAGGAPGGSDAPAGGSLAGGGGAGMAGGAGQGGVGPQEGCESDNDCATLPSTRVCDVEHETCVECLVDRDTCGAGTYCATDQVCVLGCNDDGDCNGLDCDTTLALCTGCVENEECPLGTTCSDGTCVFGCSDSSTCPTGWECCDETCVNPLTNADHCGDCGQACEIENATPACVDGDCAIGECDEGYSDCDEEVANGCESDPQSDPDNCGECGAACARSQACLAGACGQPPCGSGYEDCNGLASDGCETNTQVSEAHCGVCHHPCSTVHGEPECRSGSCSIVCDDNWGNCDDDATNGCETTLNTTEAHCGACGQACTNPHGETSCEAGRCVPQCAPHYASCDGNSTNGCETNLETDPTHCGECGEPCALPHAAPSCEDGRCGVAECLEGWLDCNGDPVDGCEVDPNTNASHCGDCNQPCSEVNGAPTCNDGTCAISCAFGYDDCDGDVTNGCEASLGTASPDAIGDVNHCSVCHNECPATEGASPNCIGGQCGISDCPEGRADCDGDPTNGCETNTDTDPDNCGGCGASCVVANGTAACLSGICAIASCEEGFDDCDATYAGGCEQSLQTIANCGACAVPCAPANAVPSCATGECAISSCQDPYRDCDGDPANGCEVDTDTSAAHCGSCAGACSTNHGTPYCTAGSCGITCATNWGDCDHDPSDGCETYLRNNSAHCGECSHSCAAAHGSAACSGTTCVITGCTDPWGDCNGSYGDGCESNTDTSVTSCGDCGVACSSAHGDPSCLGGACGISCVDPWDDCDTNVGNGCEANTDTTVSDCGECGRVCSFANAARSCEGGNCLMGACNPGFDNCNGFTNDGCEVTLATDPDHCGSCSKLCDLPYANEGCNSGNCTIASCVTNHQNCDALVTNGCEADLTSTETCGDCSTHCSVANGTPQCTGTPRVCGVASCNEPYANCDGFYANGCETNTNTSFNHCGECNDPCPSGGGTTYVCQNGNCVVSGCSGTMADCTAAPGCETDTSTSLAHCGECDNPCAPPHATGECVAGECTVDACLATFRDCDGEAGNGCEVDTATNVNHCSACNAACNLPHAAATCQNSACAIASCTGTWFDCDNLAATGCEKDRANDPANCGACGHQCNATHGTATCTNGVCGIVCSTGYADCDGDAANGCETSLTSVVSCGSCTNDCVVENGTPSCSGNPLACGIGSCADPYDDCNSNYDDGCETNTNASTSHCGDCGNVCNSINGTAQCAGGVCSITCTIPFGNCNGIGSDGCETNTNTSTSHCGSCSHPCVYANANASCTVGTCSMGACFTGYQNCDGATANGCEINTTNDVENCGGCNLDCANDHGATSCASSVCAPICTNVVSNRWGDCDGNPANGCESSLLQTSRCGTCGTICSYSNGVAACVEGAGGAQCSLTGCIGNWGNCDGNAGNGCERDMSADLANCGACGHTCGASHASPQCVSGGCLLNCASGYRSCDGDDANGCEADINSDEDNCGGCGNECSGTLQCINGVCTGDDTIALVATATGAATSNLDLTYNLQTATGNNRLLLVGLACRGNNAAQAQPDEVRFNGVTGPSLTLANSAWSQNQAWAGIYYLRDAQLPGPGSYHLIVSGVEFGVRAYVAELRGVNQNTPVSASAVTQNGPDCGGVARSTSVAVPNQGWAFDVFATWGGSTTATEGAGQHSIYEATATNDIGIWSSYKEAMAAQTTPFSWTGTCWKYGHVVVSLNRGTL